MIISTILFQKVLERHVVILVIQMHQEVLEIDLQDHLLTTVDIQTTIIYEEMKMIYNLQYEWLLLLEIMASEVLELTLRLKVNRELKDLADNPLM